jgi:hypothetical protein
VEQGTFDELFAKSEGHFRQMMVHQVGSDKGEPAPPAEETTKNDQETPAADVEGATETDTPPLRTFVSQDSTADAEEAKNKADPAQTKKVELMQKEKKARARPSVS